MRIRGARAWALAGVAIVSTIVSCGKSGGGGAGAGGGVDAGPMGPTNLVVTWTLAGMPASATTCTAHQGAQVYVNLSGTIDPSLHQTTTLDCATGTVTFSQLLVQDLGTPYLEGTLLDSMGETVTITGVDVVPTVGTTNVTLAFFAPQGTGGAGGTTTTTTTTHSSSSSTSSGSGGTGGSMTSSSSSGAASSSSSGTASSSSSSSSSSATSSGIADAGAD